MSRNTFHHGSSIVKWILSTSVAMACIVDSSLDWSSGLPTLRGRTPLYDLVRAQTLFARQCRFGRPGLGMQMGHKLFSQRCRRSMLGLSNRAARREHPEAGERPEAENHYFHIKVLIALSYYYFLE